MSGFETPATPQLNELLRSDSDKRAEFVSGSRKEKPLPGKEHARLQRRLLVLLTQFLEASGRGEAFPEWHHRFGGPNDIRIYVPDIAVVLGAQDDSSYSSRASDIMIEILSPSQNLLEFLNKVEFYLGNGASRVWVVDPESKTLQSHNQSYSRENGPQIFSGGQTFSDALLPGFGIQLPALFSGIA